MKTAFANFTGHDSGLLAVRMPLAAVCAACLFASLCAAQTNSTVTLTFNGLQDDEEIANYYNGGYGIISCPLDSTGLPIPCTLQDGGLQGSGPGPNYGITFAVGSFAIISELNNGTGNFSGNPTGGPVAYFLTGGDATVNGLVMNVAAGFTTGFSFYYSSADYTGSVTVLDANGNTLQQLQLPATGTGCDSSGLTFDCWQQVGVTFSGVAYSVNFSGTANEIGFDNITLGSLTPGQGCGLIINTSALAPGTVGSAYSQSVSASGCNTPYTWTAKGLPPNLIIGTSNGAISGTPTTPGTYPVSVTVTDSSSPPVSFTTNPPLTLVINKPALNITTTSLASGVVGTPYNQPITATGGTAPYTWTTQGLPSWASVTTANGASAISGTPTAAGTSHVTLTVTDSSSPPLSTTSPSLALTINPQSLAIATTSLANGTVGAAYNQALVATGGTPPYTWTPQGLPNWASVTSSNGTSTITGTPTAAGTSHVTLTVTDSSNPPLSATSSSLALTISPQSLAIATTSLATGTVGVAYNQPLVATGGTGPYTWTPQGLPSWASVTSSNGTSAITGTPDAAATSSVTLTVTDSSTPQLTQTATYQLVIKAPAAPSVQMTPSVTQVTSITSGVSVTLTLTAAAPADLTATLSLSFAGNATGLPSGNYNDPGLQFGQGGTTTTLAIPAGSTTASLPSSNLIATGSVAGSITVALTSLTETVNGQQQPLLLPSPNPSTTFTVLASAPTITAVKIINVTSTGFVVDIVASSTSRDLSGASFTFTPASGATLSGTTFSYSGPGNALATQATTWFSPGSSGLSYGGAFDLQVPFTLQGSANAIGSVSVTLTNSVGISGAVSGTQ